MMTDDARHYNEMGREYKGRESRDAPRNILHRYLAEFDFRCSNRIALGVDDQGRPEKTIKGYSLAG
jgi:hypothetical protein